MTITPYHGYPDRIGKRFAFAGSGIGPASYSQTTLDPVTLSGFQTQIDVLHRARTVSGLYDVVPIPSVGALRATWKLRWYVVSTGAEVANAVNLSGETVVMAGLGGLS